MLATAESGRVREGEPVLWQDLDVMGLRRNRSGPGFVGKLWRPSRNGIGGSVETQLQEAS